MATNPTNERDNVFTWTTDTPDVVTKRRQQARYDYMRRLASYRGEHMPREVTHMADKWWPDTNPTMYERDEDERD